MTCINCEKLKRKVKKLREQIKKLEDENEQLRDQLEFADRPGIRRSKGPIRI